MKESASRMIVGISLVGVAGEILILRHELVDCYPYKMLTYPPPSFYKWIAAVCCALVPLAAVAFASWLRRHVALFAPPALTAMAPLACVLILLAMTEVFYPGQIPPGVSNFDGYTKARVAREFTVFAVVLAGVGGIAGGILSGVTTGVQRLARRRAPGGRRRMRDVGKPTTGCGRS